jgi:hypothetical protein
MQLNWNLSAFNDPPGLRECAGWQNRKRPTLGDKAGLLLEKGDKSITLAIKNAIDVPFYKTDKFNKKIQH